MQQRLYQGGTATPADLAAYLVQQFEETRRLRAQTLGQGDSCIVQIGREGRTPALTLGIARRPETPGDLVVTMGEQQWFHSSSALYPVAGSLAASLFSPWALFGLIWPLKHAVDAQNLPGEVWNLIDVYLASKGAMMVQETRPTHPHLID